MERLICLLYWLKGYSGFWKHEATGRWYAYESGHLQGYWRHEAERVPLPTWQEIWEEVCRIVSEL